jgi:hypothetical protein
MGFLDRLDNSLAGDRASELLNQALDRVVDTF